MRLNFKIYCAAFVFLILTVWAPPSHAICLLCPVVDDPTGKPRGEPTCAECATEKVMHRNTRRAINQDKVEPAFEDHRKDYLLGKFVEKFWVPALQAMTQQIDNGYFEIGTQDAATTTAANTSETGDAINVAQAEIINEVRPSEALCARVTLSENVAPTAGAAVAATNVLNQITDSGLVGAAGTPSPTELRMANLETAIQTYWCPSDLNGAVGEATGFAPADPSRCGADLSAPFFENYTFDIDYGDTTTQNTEQDLQMLRYNIFGPGLTRLRTIDQNSRGFENAITARYEAIAFNAAAQSSFNAIVGLHHPGLEGTGEYYRALLQSRGITDESQIQALLGNNDAPSLLAQAKILALYTNASSEIGPDTIGTSADTRRLAIAQMGAKLLIKYELYKSLQRSALQLALLHELKIRPYQRAYEGAVGTDPLGQNDIR